MREIFADTPGVQEALESLGFEGLYDELAEQLRHITVDVDASGNATTVLVRAIMQARRDGARRTPLIVTLDAAGRAPCFVPVAGCSIGRQITDLGSGVFATELLVDRPLAQRETCLFELRVELPEPSRDTWFDHFSARRISELLVWIRFHPSRRPAKVERYTRIDDVEESEVVELGDGTGAHALARGFGPGILGIRWEW